MIGTQSHAPNPILLLLVVHLCLKQQQPQPPSATVIHRRFPWFPPPSVSFIIAGRAAAAIVSFWSRRRNHRRRKVLCHAYRIFLSVIHYWVPHFFICSLLLHFGYFYPQFKTGFRIFLSTVGHLASGFFYPQLWKNDLQIFLFARGIWLVDNFFRSVVVLRKTRAWWDFKKFVGCQSQLIRCRKQLPLSFDLKLGSIRNCYLLDLEL